MSFRLVPKSMTLDDLERRNSPNRRVKVIEDSSIRFATEMQAKESSLLRYIIYGDIAWDHPQRER